MTDYVVPSISPLPDFRHPTGRVSLEVTNAGMAPELVATMVAAAVANARDEAIAETTAQLAAAHVIHLRQLGPQIVFNAVHNARQRVFRL